MTLHPNFHSHHLEALKNELRKKFKEELLRENDDYLKKQYQEAINCLDKAIVPVDILRSIDFNSRLDKKKNFYGLRLQLVYDNAHIYAKIQNIRRSIQVTMQMMNTKDLWKHFLATILIELQSGEKQFDSLLRIGSDYKSFSDPESKYEADFIISGPRSEMDFPLLLVDISTSETCNKNQKFNPMKMQVMMTNTLIDFYNTHNHWPLPELNHLVVYGLIVVDYEFYICKMAMRPEKDNKFAFVFTRGKRFLSRTILTDPKPTKSFDEEALAESRRGDRDSTDEEDEGSFDEDDWVTCYWCQTCHYRGQGCILNDFEDLSLDEPKEKVIPKKPVGPNNGAKTYRRPHGGGVVAIVSLIQSVIAQNEIVKAKDKRYKKLKQSTD